LIKIIEDCNAYDAELFNWVRNRFAAQSAMFEPQLSEDLEIYQRNNRVLSSAGKYLPYKLRKQLAATILHGRGLGFNFFQRNASIGCVSYPQAWQQSE
jgi:hypothetical protein